MNDDCTVSQAAELLQVSERTIWNWIKKSRIKAIKENGLTRIPMTEILAMQGASQKEGIRYDAEKYVLVDRQAYESLLKLQTETLHHVAELGYRIGQLETEKRQLLLKDERPWWRRWFA